MRKRWLSLGYLLGILSVAAVVATAVWTSQDASAHDPHVTKQGELEAMAGHTTRRQPALRFHHDVVVWAGRIVPVTGLGSALRNTDCSARRSTALLMS